jgi:hypothetical protein
MSVSYVSAPYILGWRRIGRLWCCQVRMSLREVLYNWTTDLQHDTFCCRSQHKLHTYKVGHDLAETRRVWGSASLGELLFRCGRHSSASEGVHFWGEISPISPEIPRNSQIWILCGWIGWQAHRFNQVSSLIIYIYYYIELKLKGVCNRGVCNLLAHTPIFSTRSQR